MAGANWETIKVSCTKCAGEKEFRVAHKAAQVKSFSGIFLTVFPSAKIVSCDSCGATIWIPEKVFDALEGK